MTVRGFPDRETMYATESAETMPWFYRGLDPDLDRARYVENLAARVQRFGLAFIKCFSAEESGGGGPHRFAPEQIREIFSAHFDVVEIRNTVYQGNRSLAPRALFCTRRPKALKERT